MAKKIYDAVATVGEYTDKTTGQKKKRYQRVGAVFDNNGRLALKLDAVPVGPFWSGWISFMEPRQHDATPRDAAPRDTTPRDDDFDDDIPF